jgi:drug/metabolite transporter (DMT)-like permease
MNIPVLSLLFVTVVWGATFPVLKIATAQLSGIETSALRFLLAALCMLPWALRAPRKAWRDGALLGALVLFSYVAQAYGLQFISSNRSAFLTSLNVLMVPLLGMVFGNVLSWRVVLGCLWMLADAQGTDRLQTLGSRLNAEILWGLAYLGVVATAAMLFLQARAQRHVSADKAALIYAMEPVFAALFAWVWLAEGLSLHAAIGAGVVVFAVLFGEWKPKAL